MALGQSLFLVLVGFLAAKLHLLEHLHDLLFAVPHIQHQVGTIQCHRTADLYTGNFGCSVRGHVLGVSWNSNSHVFHCNT